MLHSQDAQGSSNPRTMMHMHVLLLITVAMRVGHCHFSADTAMLENSAAPACGGMPPHGAARCQECHVARPRPQVTLALLRVGVLGFFLLSITFVQVVFLTICRVPCGLPLRSQTTVLSSESETSSAHKSSSACSLAHTTWAAACPHPPPCKAKR